MGRNSYCMARVVETHPDQSGLCRRVTLEAMPRGGSVRLPYVSKNLERFQMAVQRLVLIHPRELEVLKLEDISTTPEKVTQDTENDISMDSEKIISLEDEKDTDTVCDPITVKALVRQESSDY